MKKSTKRVPGRAAQAPSDGWQAPLPTEGGAAAGNQECQDKEEQRNAGDNNPARNIAGIIKSV